MSDAIRISRHDVPAVAIITEPFWVQSALVAQSKDMPDVPRVRVPYPIAGTGRDNIAKVARAAARDIAHALALP